jgi:hypothetical protein
MRDTDRDAGWKDFIKSGSPEDYLRYRGCYGGSCNEGETEGESDSDRHRDGSVSGTFRGI